MDAAARDVAKPLRRCTTRDTPCALRDAILSWPRVHSLDRSPHFAITRKSCQMATILENFDTERFIKEIKSRPAIWDKSCDGYSNRELKKQSWAEIMRIFGGDDMSPTKRRFMQITLQMKWKGIRNCFSRELRRQRKLKAGIDPGARKSEYTHFKQMQFLRDVIKTRSRIAENIVIEQPAKSSIKQENIDDAEYDSSKCEEDDDDEEYSKLEELTDDFSKLEEVEMEFDKTDPLNEVERLRTKRPRYDSMTDDDDLLFLLSMLKTLRRVPLKNKMATRMNLMAVLNEATKDLET
ncbi:uncharacterized protein LOC112052572 [Bicyclus anynana]|uniref:Uncharacterized protein LOC112052572 n=1 Tax=Bicyclus anynana TaxID=110368 RepID=A0A6J1NQR6_BICAN|nr:uncharacterized protein LOC112052572 [Bicyclus anynana]